MPTREPGEQQHRSRSTEEHVEETAEASGDLAARKEALDADIDAILEDILHPYDILGRRTRVKVNGSKLFKV